MIIEFIVLACSHKHGGRCVAGIDVANQRLIRLISNDEKSCYAIPKYEYYLGRKELEPLDKIKVDLKNKAPILGAQFENWFVSFPLIKCCLGKAELAEIEPYVQKNSISPYPFGSKESYLNINSYCLLNYSLCLIYVHNLSIQNDLNSDGNLKTKVTFSVSDENGNEHKLNDYSITDPRYIIYKDKTTNKVNKESLKMAYLLISVGPNDDSSYQSKYVSGIIDLTNQ